MAVLTIAALAGSALVEDAGRGHRAAGVPRAGAFDRYAHAAATALVEGSPDDATIEVVGRIGLVASDAVTIAVTGVAEVRISGQGVPTWTALALPAGGELRVESSSRAWVAVAGGLQVEPMLGSRSTCLLGPIGPGPLGLGDRISLRHVEVAPGAFCRPPERSGPIRIVAGPHLDLTASRAEVIDASRIGVRLRPAANSARAHTSTASLPSLGVLPGTIQVLPSGEWMVLGPDAGTMGGYPVAGVVCTADLDRLAHVAPGQWVDLVAIPAESAPQPDVPEIIRVDRLPG